MAKITVYGAEWCQGCKFVKAMLGNIQDVEIEYVDVDEDVERAQKAGVRALPTYINEDTGDRGTGAVRNTAELKEKLGLV